MTYENELCARSTELVSPVREENFGREAVTHRCKSCGELAEMIEARKMAVEAESIG